MTVRTCSKFSLSKKLRPVACCSRCFMVLAGKSRVLLRWNKDRTQQKFRLYCGRCYRPWPIKILAGCKYESSVAFSTAVKIKLYEHTFVTFQRKRRRGDVTVLSVYWIPTVRPVSASRSQI